MRVALVGADFEENLGVGMIASAAVAAGHHAKIVPFDWPEDAPRVVERVLAAEPDVIGLGIQFQHRAAEFLDLAERLRASGFAGHITAGGQYPSLAWKPALEQHRCLDSIVLYEGERSFVALLSHLAAGTALDDVAGLALRAADGHAYRTRGEALLPNLDELPFPARYREHARHCGVPFIPIMGSRGCWGACSYCAITSFYRDARAHGGGKTLRHRSPDNVADEMAELWYDAGPSLFCFHDDNFLLPRPADSLARIRGIREALDARGVGKVGMIGKCRPDSMTADLARELRALGVIRLYVGVENASELGSEHLNRRMQTPRVREALRACREAGIFVCYNLLLFEPDATIADIEENVAFMREHAAHPVNFCRAEPYFGTPLHRLLDTRQMAIGDHLGFTYRIEDDRTELLFRICAAAFRQRNFDPAGVANRTMGLGYSAKILEFFYEDEGLARARLSARADRLTHAISSETAGFLETAIHFAKEIDPRDEDAIARRTARLGLEIATADRMRHAQLDELYRDMEAFGASRPRTSGVFGGVARSVERMARRMAFGASVAALVPACESCGGPAVMPVDPPPPPISAPVVPPPPTTTTTPHSGPVLPPTQNQPPPTVMPVDPPPMPITPGGSGAQGGVRRPPPPPPPDPVPRPQPPPPPDPVPRPQPPPPPDPVPAPHSSLPGGAPRHRLEVIDQWRDTTARSVARSADLPLTYPPTVTLAAVRVGRSVRVVLSAPEHASVRWESGALSGDTTAEGSFTLEEHDRIAVWMPDDADDQIRVAVRTETGVAIAALRAADVA